MVKTNVGSVLRKEVSSPRWQREHVAMGTNTDPYQRAKGRYRLMPEIISALADSGTPFSILTKGTVLSRDLPLLAAAAVRSPWGSVCRWPCWTPNCKRPSSPARRPRRLGWNWCGESGTRAAVRRVRRADTAPPDRRPPTSSVTCCGSSRTPE